MKKLLLLTTLLAVASFTATAEEATTNLTVTLTKEQLDVIKRNTPTNTTPQDYFAKRVKEEVDNAAVKQREQEITKIVILLRKATPAKRKEVLDLLSQ